MAKLGDPRDAWHNFGFVYGRSGASRGTTTSTGVITVETGFSRQVVFAEAYPEGNFSRVAALTTAQSTTVFFQPITPDGITARFRVKRWLQSGDNNGSFVLAASITGITFRWMAFGY